MARIDDRAGKIREHAGKKDPARDIADKLREKALIPQHSGSRVATCPGAWLHQRTERERP